MTAPYGLPHDACVYIAGHRGLVGGAIWRALQARGIHVVGRTSLELDLRDREAVFAFFHEERITHVVLAAAKVGGILANATFPADFLSDNLRIQLNVMDAAQHADIERLLFLGSSCVYPKFAEQPIREDSLLTGPLEQTNDAYAIAKIAGIMQVQAVRRQHGLPWISAMPTNLYGPGDNFDLHGSHVLPAMMRKMHEAKVLGHTSVLLWGSGAPRREFLHVDDLAQALLILLEEYDDPQTINVGTGQDITIRELAELVCDVVGYDGELAWDASKSDGTPRKLLDISRLTAYGWRPTVPLREGVASTYDWFCEQVKAGALRV